MGDKTKTAPVDSPSDEDSVLRERLTLILNHASRENRSGTPDFILAGFMLGCLNVFEAAVSWREGWRGRTPKVAEKAQT